MPRFCALLIAFVTSLGLPAVAHARQIEYRPAAGCPSREDVVAKLDADAPNGRNARIDIEAWKSGYRGQVTVGEGEHQLVRSIEARTCSAVVQALAVVVALDRDESEPAPAVEDAPKAVEARSADEGAAPPATTPPTSPDAPATAPPRARPRSITFYFLSDTRVTSFARGHTFFGGGGGWEIGAARGFAGLRPSVRASFLYLSASWSERSPLAAELSFDLLGGAIDGCLNAPRPMKWFEVGACSRTEIAALTADAYRAVDSSTQWWVATGASGVARVFPFSIAYLPIMLEASAGFLVPMVRDRFHFTGVTVTAEPVLWTAAIGIGTVF